MPSKIKHLYNLVFGARVSDERIQSLISDIAFYIAGICEDLPASLKNHGVHLGHRAPSLRREAISFFAVAAKSSTIDHPERLACVKSLIEELKKQTNDQDHAQKRFSVTTETGVSLHGVGKVNLLAKTIDDRLNYYFQETGRGEKFKVCMRLAFASAHVLDGDTLSGKTIQGIQEELLCLSGKVKQIHYPDERRDEFIADWISKAVEPVQIQLDDLFYVVKHKRIP